MRVVIACVVAASLFLVASAADMTSCGKKCEARFENDDKKACLSGCAGRGQIADGGPLSFVKCHRGCDNDFGNSTEGEKRACHFACALPMHSSVAMTLINDNGKPRWKVVRQDGDDEPIVTIQDKHPISGLLNLRAPASQESSDSSHDDDDESDGWDDMDEVQAKMQRMFDEVRRQFVQSIRESMSREAEGALQRPVGHSPWGEASIRVGNENEEGKPIISVRPLDNDESPQAILLELRRRDTPRSQLRVLFNWLIIATGIVALLTTMLAIALFLRSLRSNRYHRMGHDGVATMPVFARVQQVAPLPVKKVPEEGWIEQAQPSGVAPPAYDQVSIHHSPKAADSDKSTSEAETPSPMQ